MDCSFVVSVFFIVLLLNTGLQTDGQVLTLCKDPLLSTRCTLQCSRGAANESVLLYKETSVKIECGEDNICSKTDAIYADSSNANSVKFHILKLEYADRANWTCKSGGRSGRTRELQVYSFKDENVAYDIRSISRRRHNVTVTIECVMPIPEIHVGFCDDQICRGKGKAFFNGPCAYPGIETQRQLNCIMDLNHRGARCNLKKEPIQISLIMDDRNIYSTKTNEVFSYGYAPKSPVRIITIKQDIKGQCRDFNTAITVAGGVFIGGCALLVVFCVYFTLTYIGCCCIEACVKKNTNTKKGVPLLPKKGQKNKETSHHADGKDNAGAQEASDAKTEV